MSATRRMWKVRRDGVRQRYRVAEPAHESGVYKTLARAYAHAYKRGNAKRYNAIAQIPHAERMFPELARRRAYATILNLIEQLGAQGARAVPALRWIYEQSVHHIADDEKRHIVKSSAREAIAGIGGVDAIQFHADILYDKFDEPNWHDEGTEKRAACDYLGAHRSDVGLDALHHALLHDSYFVSQWALRAIRQYDDPRSTPVFEQVLKNPPSENLLRDIINILHALDLRALAPAVLDVAQHVELELRQKITMEIATTHDPETIAAFIQHGALKHPNFTVREATCLAIARAVYREAIPMLQQLYATEKSERVRKAAQYALEVMDALPKRVSSKRASPKRR